nr:MAG TPA: hypothetical protein [Caudoviricetes sp.]
MRLKPAFMLFPFTQKQNVIVVKLRSALAEPIVVKLRSGELLLRYIALRRITVIERL